MSRQSGRPDPDRRRPLELSGALARSGALTRSAGLRRTATREREPMRSLIRCRVGPVPLVIDLRDMTAVQPSSGRSAGTAPIDLAAIMGVERQGPAEVLNLRASGGESVALLVDAGSELCAVNLSGLQPLPPLLEALSTARYLRGVIVVAGELHFLLDPRGIPSGGSRGR